jgi:hypothetical protein
MLTSRENFFHNLSKSEVLQRAVKKEPNPRALKKADFLIKKVGVTFVEAVKASYDAYLADPKNPRKATNYCKWRLRLHIKVNNDREKLELLDGYRDLGLNNDGPGPLCWDYEIPFQG